MNRLVQCLSGALLVASLSGIPVERAKADAFAGVDNAFWSATYFGGTLPSGISFNCFGDATPHLSASGCSDYASLILTNDSAADITLSLSHVGGFSLTNTTDDTIYDPFRFGVGYSAFNPGGPQIGASVDDPLNEFASFSSSVSGPGASDSHACNTVTGPNFVTPTACGVFSPDSNISFLFVGPLAPGDTYTATYHINIIARAIGVPEPSTLAVFGLCLAMLTMAGYRRRADRQPADLTLRDLGSS